MDNRGVADLVGFRIAASTMVQELLIEVFSRDAFAAQRYFERMETIVTEFHKLDMGEDIRHHVLHELDAIRTNVGQQISARLGLPPRRPT